MLSAAVIALLWSNSPWGDSYAAVVDFTVGPASLHLDLSLGVWAADGLLAVFFFVAGLELKHELVHGSLSSPARAAVPVAAALGGMLVPALLFLAVNLSSADGSPRGWGVPIATDIAFALAVLAVVGRRLPVALRAFLLTLAVADDLGAIIVIALFYSSAFAWPYALATLGCLGIYWLAQRQRIRSPLLYVPLALATWGFMHASGIHATVAGVALALLTRSSADPGESAPPADRLQRRLLPLSAGFCVPVFALLAAGVDLRATGLWDALQTPVALGIILGLVIGKPIGVVGVAWIVARFTRASLNPAITWRDVTAVGLLAGIGFTVALLITELGYAADPSRLESAKTAVLVASLISAVIASLALLRLRRRAAAEVD